MLRFHLLGGLRITHDEIEVKGFVSHKAQALLVYLVITGRPHFRESLQGLLWGDAPQKHAAINLRVALNNLRQLFPEHIIATRDSVSFAIESEYWLDVRAFEAQANQPGIAGLQSVVELYQGDLLAGFNSPSAPVFEEWLLAERERLRLQMLQALHVLSETYTARGEYLTGIEYTSRLLTMDPWREESHRLLMQLLALSGQRSAALAQYEQCRRLLRQELGLEPLEETVALYNQIKSWEQGGRVVTESFSFPQAAQGNPLPFIGREEEHARLVGWWREALSGKGRLTLVEGEGGIGKTRLMNEVIRFAASQGAGVLLGQCYEFGGSLPYHPLAQAISLSLIPATLSPVWLAELSRLLPELRERVPGLPAPEPSGGEESRLRLFESVTRFVKALAEHHRRLVIFLDDLQWADQPTLDLLQYIFRGLQHEPVWFVGAYRPEETGPNHPLTCLQQRLNRDRLVNCLVLQPLPTGAVEKIAAALAPAIGASASLCMYLYRESEGNPFVLAEIIASLQECGYLQNQPGLGWTWNGSLPDGLLPIPVKDLILQRVRRLGETAQGLLDLAAVNGHSFDLAFLLSISVVGSAVAIECLEEWMGKRLIRLVNHERATGVTEGLPIFDFNHDKIRTVVYHSISPARRSALHQQIGEALENRFQGQVELACEDLAYHYEQAGVAEKALVYLPLAAEKAELVNAHQQALEFYRRALVLYPQVDERRWGILLKQADILRLAGEYDHAIQSCQQIVAGGNPSWQSEAYCSLAQIYCLQRDFEQARQCAWKSERLALNVSDAPGRRAQSLQVLGEIEREQGNLEGAHRLFAAALEIYRRTGEIPGQANCLLGLGGIFSARGEYSQALQWFQEALTMFQTTGNRQSTAASLYNVGSIYWRQRDYTASHQAFSESLEICQAAGDRRGEAVALNGLGPVAIAQDDHRETQRCWNASIAIYRQLGLEKRVSAGLHNLSISYMECGNMALAQKHLEESLELDRSTGFLYGQAMSLGWLGKLHWLLRNYPVATACLDEALALDSSLGGGEEKDWHLLWRIAVACESGELDNALQYLHQMSALISSGCANLKPADLLYWTARIHLAQGEGGLALRAARQNLVEIQSYPLEPKRLAEGYCLLGMVNARSLPETGEDPTPYFQKALDLITTEPPMATTRAFTLEQYGRYLNQAGMNDRAVALLHEARAIYERIGAHRAAKGIPIP